MCGFQDVDYVAGYEAALQQPVCLRGQFQQKQSTVMQQILGVQGWQQRHQCNFTAYKPTVSQYGLPLARW